MRAWPAAINSRLPAQLGLVFPGTRSSSQSCVRPRRSVHLNRDPLPGTLIHPTLETDTSRPGPRSTSVRKRCHGFRTTKHVRAGNLDQGAGTRALYQAFDAESSKPVKPFPVYLPRRPPNPFPYHQSHSLDGGDHRDHALSGRLWKVWGKRSPPAAKTAMLRPSVVRRGVRRGASKVTARPQTRGSYDGCESFAS